MYFIVHILLKIPVIGVPLLVVVVLLVALVVVAVYIVIMRKLCCRYSKVQKPSQVPQEGRNENRAHMNGTHSPNKRLPEYAPQAKYCMVVELGPSNASMERVLFATPHTSSSSASRTSSSLQINQPNAFPQGSSTLAQQAPEVNAPAVNLDGSIPTAQPAPNPNLRQQRTREETSFENVSESRRNLLGSSFSISPTNIDSSDLLK